MGETNLVNQADEGYELNLRVEKHLKRHIDEKVLSCKNPSGLWSFTDP